jgi:hypothetical protein
MKDFVTLITDHYYLFGDPRPNYFYTQIAVIQFSSYAQVLINLTQTYNSQEFQQLVITNVFYQRFGAGLTNTTE